MAFAPGGYFYGWEWLLKSIEKDLNKNSDILIALVHFILVKHSLFLCVGVGEDKTLSSDEIRSELLPYDWNSETNSYALRYVNVDKLYLLLANVCGDGLFVHILDVERKKVSNLALSITDSVTSYKEPTLFQIIPNVTEIANRIKMELIDDIFKGHQRAINTQTSANCLFDNNVQRETPRPRAHFPTGWHPIAGFLSADNNPRLSIFPTVRRIYPHVNNETANVFPVVANHENRERQDINDDVQ